MLGSAAFHKDIRSWDTISGSRLTALKEGERSTSTGYACSRLTHILFTLADRVSLIVPNLMAGFISVS